MNVAQDFTPVSPANFAWLPQRQANKDFFSSLPRSVAEVGAAIRAARTVPAPRVSDLHARVALA
jgi:hypothetical protein